MKKLKDYIYYKTNLGTHYKGDCLKILPLLKKEKIDLLYTDPVWPNSIPDIIGHEDPYKLFKKAMRISKRIKLLKRYAIHLGCDSDPRFLKAVPRKFKFLRLCWLRYVRPHYKGRILYSGDACYLFGKAQRRIISGKRVIPGEITNINKTSHKNDHPCPRALTHVEFIISIFSNPGEIVIDPFGGSGTTAVACEKLNRRWIIIEIEDKHCKNAKQRIENENNKLKLGLKTE